MALQLTITYSDCKKETDFFVSNDCQFLGIDIKTNENSNQIKFPQTFKPIVYNLESQDTINLDFDKFLAYLLPKEKISFEGKTIETLIFSCLFNNEEKILASELRKLPI